MAETIQGFSPTLHHQQKPAVKDDLTLKVFVKVFTKEKLDRSDIYKINNCLDYMFDEPCIFYSKDNDVHTKETLSNLGVRREECSMVNLRSFNKRSTVVVFVIKNINKNIRKIIEIICKDMFSYSIIFV